MTLEQLVPSLEVCQQLKAAGFPQDAAFSWYPADSPDDAETVRQDLGEEFIKRDVFVFMTGKCDDALCAAPTAEEILKELPATISMDGRELGLQAWRADDDWMVGWYRYNPEFDGDGEQPDIVLKPLITIAAESYLWWKKEVAG